MKKTRKKYRINEIGSNFGDAPFGTALKTKDYSDNGIPVIQGRNIINDVFQWNHKVYVTEEKFNSLMRSHCQEGDLVFQKIGNTIGIVAIMPSVEGHKFFLLSTNMMKMSTNPNVAITKYVYYYFCQKHVKEFIKSSAGGGAQPIFNFTTMKNFQIELPELLEQKKIAAILSTYDDLIENNTRRIKILEEMAQAIYREWFVNFRFPGHAGVRMVESELGLVPEGWEIVKVPDAVIINPRISLSKEGIKSFLSMGCLSENTMNVQTIEYREGNSGSKFQNGDTLFARITPCLENGKTVFIQFLPTDSDIAFGSTEFIVLRSRTLTPEFVYLLSRTDSFRDNAIKSMSGVTGRQRVQEECFKKYLIAHPDMSTLNAFDKIIKPIFNSVFTLSLKNANLRRTRDLLLPKLISGEIDVSGLDIEVPAA